MRSRLPPGSRMGCYLMNGRSLIILPELDAVSFKEVRCAARGSAPSISSVVLICLARRGSGIGDTVLYNRVGDETTLNDVERIKTLSGRWPR